ncbi:MAG: hypothetical protein ACYTG3_08075 [Planctomycetota bacterium]|jgi:hypothetical protein
MLAAVLCLVVGCGSDGETTLAPLAITSANAEMVAQQGVGATDVLMQMSGLVEGYSQVFDNPSPQLVPCDSGQGNLVLNDVGAPGLSTGDSASMTFLACVFDADGIPITMNGNISFTASDVTGTPPGPFSYALVCSFNSYSVNVLGATVIVNGGFTLELSTTDGDTYQAVVHGDYFSVYAQAGLQAFSGTISNFRMERTYTESTGAYSVDNQATIAGSQLGGEVTFDTTVPFTGTDPDDPDAGTLVVTGAEGATLTLVAIDNIDVQILVDLEGDGNTDATILTTWDVLNDDS